MPIIGNWLFAENLYFKEMYLIAFGDMWVNVERANDLGFPLCGVVVSNKTRSASSTLYGTAVLPDYDKDVNM